MWNFMFIAGPLLTVVFIFQNCTGGFSSSIQNKLATESPTNSGYDVIVIAGQSNAVGFGCGSYIDEPKRLDDRIDMLDADGQIVPAHDPLSHSLASTVGIGFGMTFARLYAQTIADDRRILLVPSAKGSTSILEWNQLTPYLDPSAAGLVNIHSTAVAESVMARTKNALYAHPGKNSLVALLWHQGENDYSYIVDPTANRHVLMPDYLTYQSYVLQFMSDFRAIFSSPRLPIVMGEIGRFWNLNVPNDTDGVVLSKFLQGQHNVADALGNSATVSSLGLVNGQSIGCAFSPASIVGAGDPYHFSAASQIELGRRYYQAFAALPK